MHRNDHIENESSDEENNEDNCARAADAESEDEGVEVPGWFDNDAGNWSYHAFSVDGAEYAKGAKTLVTTQTVKLEYNTTDELLLNRAVQEAKNALEKARNFLGKQDKLNAMDAFSASLPKEFLKEFLTWLCHAPNKPNEELPFPSIFELAYFSPLRLACVTVDAPRQHTLA